MEELNVDKYLILKKPEEEGPEIRGGTVDALIIQATKTARNGGKINIILPYYYYGIWGIMCIVVAIFLQLFYIINVLIQYI